LAGLLKAASDVPVIDIAAAGLGTYFGAQEDINTYGRPARRWNNLVPTRPQPTSRATGSAGALLGTVARSGLFIGQVVLVLGTLLFVGLYVALLLAMLTPETIWERPARLAITDRLRSRGFDLSVS
jgi:hypothetical protein